MKNRNDNIEITELFMATACGDFSRCFYGTIKRLQDEDGSDYCFGKVAVNNGFVCARADTQEELGKQLDEIVLWVLDYGLNEVRGISQAIAGTEVFLN